MRKIGVNIFVPAYQYGVVNDGELVTGVLEDAGFRARVLRYEGGLRSRFRRSFYRPPLGKFLRRDFNIFIEQFAPFFFDMARIQVLIPNQEWMREWEQPALPQLDLVICKTRHAEEIFTELGCPTAFSSFTSQDRRLPDAEPKCREFFLMTTNHSLVAGRVLSLWARHPEWPKLTVSGREIPDDLNLPNVSLIRDFVATPEIARLQNAHLFHLCLNAAEGFGHKINEALSCGAVVIATDGAPMNELIRPERGFLVKASHTCPKRLGTEYHFDEDDLERTIEQCLRLTPEEIARLGANARRWFEENDRSFRRTLPEIMRNALTSAAPKRPSSAP